MKKVYFVRHGESEGNVGPIRQTSVTSLTYKGRVQADAVANRCARLSFDLIISSTMNRAKETAHIINEKTKKPIEYSDLFVERRRSSDVLGKPKDDPAALKAENEIEQNFHKSGWRYSDEENFDDLKDRALKALKHLADRPEENILVVTHGLFMRIVMACVVFGDDLKGEECVRFMRSFHMDNTGLTALDYDEENPQQKWHLWIWNDHAHLG
jgi:broad specificity phosphatase PhoE